MFGGGCITILAKWLGVLGRKTSGLLREVHLEEMSFQIEKIDSEVQFCMRFLWNRGLPTLASEIFVELLTDAGDRLWVNSAFAPVIEGMPQVKQRRDGFLADGDAAMDTWWD